MKLELAPNSCTPLASQVAEGICDWIVKHGAGGGSRLPSIRRLSSDLGISRNTAIEAYDRLVAQGLVCSRPGSGFYVTDNATSTLDEQPVETTSLEEFTSDMWALFQSDKEELKLGCGWLPNHWREEGGLTYAIRQVTRQNRSGLFEYSSPMGTPELRVLLRERLRLLGIDVAADQILLTAGASHALDLIVRHMLEPGDTVFVESPGYYNLLGLLRLHRVKIVGVSRLAGGPDPQHMEALLKDHRPKLFFTNSVFQNPTGTTLVPTVAHRILQLAEVHDFRIVEDDIYTDFQHDPSIRLAALDGLRRVIYLGSFSKSLTSSLRVGFLAAEPEMMKPLVDIKMLTSIAASSFAEQVVQLMLQNGSYRKLVERLRTRLSGQMAAALNQVKNSGWEVFVEPAGGMFLWVRHPEVESSSQLVTYAKRAGVSLTPGHLFLPQGDDSPWLRINVAYLQDHRAARFVDDPFFTRR
ncbi:aminotransferase-like domain-containing protein [Chromohalobacter israelensis]|uniref:aminotransferase-like domain-containing protein n=1 Tax=Chromohalobacter israelensis TaxID=141390 RepID=UPI000FFE4DCE|nr:PLP-dependent aminotransferase family protein [Chromohalobacter salexigens]RXE46531.1 GntR family transcriptional regulator [Chromohalobacter salexigens]